MPTVLRIRGHRFFFSREYGEPPHIHVSSAENYAKFWLQPIALAESYGYNARELGKVRRMVEENAELLEEKWNEYHGTT